MDHSIRFNLLMVIFLLTLINQPFLIGRSRHRPVDQTMPEISACWRGQDIKYRLKDSHLEHYPYFGIFNHEYLLKFNLPDDQIAYRYDHTKSVSGMVLKQQIEELIQEIKEQKLEFQHFTLLQNKDFNHRYGWGLIVLKFKEYPFVVKLFIETPESFVNPYSKGIEPIFFFFMGGGVNRHLTGFSRIKNRELVREKIMQHPTWASRIDFPRKWFWVPPNTKWMHIEGCNLKLHQRSEIDIPGTYCVIADEIIGERHFSIQDPKDRLEALSLCNDMSTCIDPHIKNFMVEKGTGKLVIVDTEHFPSAVGLKKTREFRSYTQWYFHLVSKCCHDIFGRTKRERMQNRTNPDRMYLVY